MEITSVIIRKLYKEEDSTSLKAVVSVTVDDVIAIHNIRIVKGKSGLFIAFPSEKKGKLLEFRDTVHPINQETRDYFEKEIYKEYYKQLEKGGNE